MQFLEELTRFIPSLPLPIDAANHYGEIRRNLEKKVNPLITMIFGFLHMP